MISADLAQFALSGRPSQGAHAMMRLSLFDWAVCGYAGRDEPVVRIVRAMLLAEGGNGPATMIGAAARAPMRAAALLNGTASHALDYDDTHFAYIGHPSVVVVSAALAAAEQAGADGAQFLDACTIGAELAVRVGVWLGRGHYDAGFHQTATAGSFGAAAAAGRLLGLNEAQMIHAFGIVSTKAAGLKSQFGTMGKPYHAGSAAALGLEAIMLAQGGFISHKQGLEGAQGFGETHHGAADASAFETLGEQWMFDAVSHKFHACCHGAHAAIEAVATLKQRLEDDSVAGLQIAVHPSWLKVCAIEAPQTGMEAKFSLQLIAAMVLDGVDTARLDSFSDAACHVPELVALRQRVRVVGDASIDIMAAHVRLDTGDGRRLEAVHDLRAPMALPDRATKLRGKARALLGDPIFAPIWHAITAQESPDVTALAAALRETGTPRIKAVGG
ncbi:MAG: MmgE/PrpD family protein [Pseudomonadota bacterium]